MPSRLSVQLWGAFEVRVDGEAVATAAGSSHKVCQLLKILVTLRQRVVASEELIEWLWPHLTPLSAHNSLWVAVSRLRQLLEPDLTERGASTYILTYPSGYRFHSSQACEIDVDRFLELIQAGRQHQHRCQWQAAIDAYTAARALYRGDYLAEDPYEEWAIPTRRRLGETALDLEEALASCLLALGRCNEALTHARDVLDRDAYREGALGV